MFSKISKHLWIDLFIIGGVFVLDQITKLWALGLGHTWPWLDLNFLKLQIGLTLNKGAVFGLPVPNWLVIFLSLVVLSACLFWWIKKKPSSPQTLGLAFVLGGALGNLADRLRLGGVVDFIEIGWFDWTWSRFNFADVFIIVGVIFLLKKVYHVEKIS